MPWNLFPLEYPQAFLFSEKHFSQFERCQPLHIPCRMVEIIRQKYCDIHAVFPHIFPDRITVADGNALLFRRCRRGSHVSVENAVRRARGQIFCDLTQKIQSYVRLRQRAPELGFFA